jgi:hypothetical protein
MKNTDQASVTCYSGNAYAQEPRAFDFNNERRTVTALRKRWREPSGPHFKVLADDGAIYVLAYDEAADDWHISAAKTQPRFQISQNDAVRNAERNKQE